MNAATGKKPLTIKGFKGMFQRGRTDVCPQDHLQDCYNCVFQGDSQVSIRDPITVSSTLPGTRTVISFFVATLSGGPVLLTLSTDGKLYDETHNTLLINFGAGVVDDFSAINVFGRCYLCFKYQSRALTNGVLYYYDGTNFIAAAGIAPVAGVTLAQANPGNVDVGIHGVAVSFLYRTGYLSPPSPITNITSTGTNDIEVSNIPTGGAGVVGRVLLMTKANQLVLFFVPGGTINDNVTTTAVINVYDTSLISSADYLNRVMTSVPAGTALKFYNGRLILIGQWQFPDQILASEVDLPESFDNVNDIINMPVDYGINNCNGGLILRKSLYITKPYGTYIVQDNGGVPNTWSVDPIDTGLGAYDVGITIFSSSMSGQDVMDRSFVANKTGLMLFDGSFSAMPLTWKIESVWQLIDPKYFYNVQVTHDIWRKRVYISVPLQAPSSPGQPITTSTFNNLILFMDYQDGLDYLNVKWSGWFSASLTPIKKISAINFTNTYTGVPTVTYFLFACKGDNYIYKMVPVVTPNTFPDDFPSGQPKSILQYIITAPVTFGYGISVFTMLNFDLLGVGSAALSLYDKYKTAATTLRPFNLTNYTLAPIDLQRNINYQTEGMSIQIVSDQTKPLGLNGSFNLSTIEVYGQLMYNSRPAFVESS